MNREPKEFADLGPLESAVMEIVWKRGESSVGDLVQLLNRPLAYTTVMTTLDRLYKKGLLDRRRQERAFLYVANHTRDEWERRRAGEFLNGYLTRSKPESELLISCFVESVGGYDPALLDELETRIRQKREELKRQARESSR